VVFAAAAGWKFLFLPVLTGAVVIVALGAVYHRLVQRKAWPASPWRWLSPPGCATSSARGR
jgi:CBS-domain-containing membrane protein